MVNSRHRIIQQGGERQKMKKLRLFLPWLMAVSLALLPVGALGADNGAVTVSIQPSHIQVVEDSHDHFDVAVDWVEDFGGSSFTVTYDPTVTRLGRLPSVIASPDRAARSNPTGLPAGARNDTSSSRVTRTGRG